MQISLAIIFASCTEDLFTFVNTSEEYDSIVEDYLIQHNTPLYQIIKRCKSNEEVFFITKDPVQHNTQQLIIYHDLTTYYHILQSPYIHTLYKYPRRIVTPTIPNSTLVCELGDDQLVYQEDNIFFYEAFVQKYKLVRESDDDINTKLRIKYNNDNVVAIVGAQQLILFALRNPQLLFNFEQWLANFRDYVYEDEQGTVLHSQVRDLLFYHPWLSLLPYYQEDDITSRYLDDVNYNIHIETFEHDRVFVFTI